MKRGYLQTRRGGFVTIALALAITASDVAATSRPVALRDPDAALLNDLQRGALRFYVEHTDPRTGLTRDRAPADGSRSTAPASIAATGFALTAWCVADARGWLPEGEALRRVRRTLAFVANEYPHERGWLFHFTNAATGRRAWNCEASTIDTALFLQGAIFAREYLRDAETSALVQRIYARVDWRWALNGAATLSHGWRPESGFIPHRWDSYSELMGLYLLGIGAPRNPLGPEAWHAWRRDAVSWYDGRRFIQCGPLFTHQYAHGWFDFRQKRDAYADYWQNSVDATLAQRAWAARQSGRFAHWSADAWGLTSSDSARGYVAWGTPGREPDQSDGTLVPCAPAGSLPFAPRECLTALERMRELGGAALYGRYGFADAFNPETGWTSPDVIGIDLGITLVMAENFRSEMIWRTFMRAPEVERGMRLAGFTPTAPATRAIAVVAAPKRVTRRDAPRGQVPSGQ